MTRVIPIVSLILLAACSDNGPLAPAELPVAPPSLAVLTNAGGVDFATGSECTYSTQPNGFTCAYTAVNLPPGPASVKIWTTYRVQWQCVHRKTGKTSPKYPPATNLFGANVDAQVGAAPSGGQLSGSDIFISPPTQSALLHLCVNNSGAFTDVRIVSAPIPWAWSIAAWNDADPAGYYAELLQNIP